MSTLLEKARLGKTIEGLDIIDIHGHLGACPFGTPRTTPDDLIALMDRIGVRTTVVAHTSCMYGHVEEGNREVWEAMQEYPGRILGYVVTWPLDGEQVRRDFERWFEKGFTGLKLHNANGFDYTEPDYQGALAAANERKCPVLLHTWASDEMFQQVCSLSDDFPDISLILGHGGCDREEKYIEIAKERENVFLDICLSKTRRGMVKRLVEGAGPDKVLWGSDALFLNMAHQIGKALGADIPEEHKHAILSNNARRILGRVER